MRVLPFSQIGLRAITGGPRSLAQPTFCPNWPSCHNWWSSNLLHDLPFAHDDHWFRPFAHDDRWFRVLPMMTGVPRSLAQPTFCPNWPSCHNWWFTISRATYLYALIGLRAITGGPQSLALPTFCPYWPLCHDQWSAMPSRPTFAHIGLRAMTGGPQSLARPTFCP